MRRLPRASRLPAPALGLALALLLVLPAASAPGPGAAAAEPPCEPEDIPGLGPACSVPGGWRVFLADRSSVTTHGPDLGLTGGSGGPGAAAPVPRPPSCALPNFQYHLVIYARPFDRPDRYAALLSSMREAVRLANGQLYADASAYGPTRSSDYIVLCDATGNIVVKNEVLPTSADLDGFSTIVNDLRALGYNSIRVKYWVFYDDVVTCVSPTLSPLPPDPFSLVNVGCLLFGGGFPAGLGTWYDDDLPILNNKNNGAPGTTSSYAMVFLREPVDAAPPPLGPLLRALLPGVIGGGPPPMPADLWHVLMHESGHTLGAVQHSAPHSDCHVHAMEPGDIMQGLPVTICLHSVVPPDVEPRVGLFLTCPGAPHYDCNGDDYFRPVPAPPGNYLATHWNIARPDNRFVVNV